MLAQPFLLDQLLLVVLLRCALTGMIIATVLLLVSSFCVDASSTSLTAR
jgi:hypothetical protein